MSSIPRLESLEPRVNPATFVVSNTLSGDVAGSLARAILDSNSTEGFDTIAFDPAVFGPAGETRIVLTEALPTIFDGVTIQGLSNLRLSIERDLSAPEFRIFTIQSDGFVQLSDLRIAQGRADQGAGILNFSTLNLSNVTIELNAASNDGLGGGILSFGSIFLDRSIVRNNSVGVNGRGGGIAIVGGGLDLYSSTVANNEAGSGGGLFLETGDRSLFLSNSTLSGNRATNSVGFGGGAILVDVDFGSIFFSVESSTLAFNDSASPERGGIVATGATQSSIEINYHNSIFAFNSGANFLIVPGDNDFFGNLVSFGHNLSTDGTGNLLDATDQPNTDPLLRPLADYGGPVPTHALLPESPAIDAGTDMSSESGTPFEDARGVARIGFADVGAFESSYALEIVSGNNQFVAVGNAVAEPFVVQLLENGLPAVGVPVTFTATPGLTFAGESVAVVVVDDAGLASSPTALAGSTPNIVTITAATGNLSRSFELFITAGPLAGYVVDAPPVSILPGEPFFLDVKPVDAFGNSFPLDAGGLSFSSTDPAAILPPPFFFSEEGNLEESAPGFFRITGFTLNTFGTQTLTLTPISTSSSPDPVSLPVYVVNTAPPTLSIGGDGTVMVNEPFTRSGVVNNFQDKEFFVQADFGDGSGVVPISVAEDGTFVLNHVYTTPGEFVVTVRVVDEFSREDVQTINVVVTPEPVPQLQIADNDEFGNVGVPFRRTGQIDDPQNDSQVIVDYGDGSVERLTLAEDGSFSLDHVYPQEGSFVVRVSLLDGEEVVQETTFFADILLAGVPTNPAVKEEVPPGTTVIITVPGATVVYENNGNDFAAIIVALVPVPIAATLDTEFFVRQNLAIVRSFDIRAINVSPLDVATVTFRYPRAANEVGDPVLTFFNVDTGKQQLVRSSVYVVDTFQRLITFVLDSDSIPALTELNGTVFTIAVPVNVPVPLPPVVTTPTPPVSSATFGSLILASLLVTDQSRLAFATNSTTLGDNSTAQQQRGGAPEEGGVRLLLSGGRVGEEEAEARLEGGPLRELPPVPPVLTDLPSVTITPAGAEPLSDSPPSSGSTTAGEEAEPTEEPAPPDTPPLDDEIKRENHADSEEARSEAEDLSDSEALFLLALLPLLRKDSRRSQGDGDDLFVVAGEDGSIGKGGV